MIHKSKLNDVLVVDIETTTEFETAKELKEKKPALYNSMLKKVEYYLKHDYDYDDGMREEDIQMVYEEKMPLYPEYSKIIGISCGGFKDNEIKTISFFDHNEKNVLIKFFDFFNKKLKFNKSTVIVGYNIMGFDIPFIAKRSMINSISVPDFFMIGDKKPWNLTEQFKDLFTFWQMGSRNYISLDTLGSCLSIETHKSEMDGSKVYEVYYRPIIEGSDINQNINEIKDYCEKDVILTAKIIERLAF